MQLKMTQFYSVFWIFYNTIGPIGFLLSLSLFKLTLKDNDNLSPSLSQSLWIIFFDFAKWSNIKPNIKDCKKCSIWIHQWYWSSEFCVSSRKLSLQRNKWRDGMVFWVVLTIWFLYTYNLYFKSVFLHK